MEILDLLSKEPIQGTNALRSPQILSTLYKWALEDHQATEIVTMRNVKANQLVGLGILYCTDSRIANYFPLASKQVAAISGIVLRPEEFSTSPMTMLLAFAVSQIKMRGFSVAQIRAVSHHVLP